MFIDEATITVRSGKGGDGAVSFRREKFVPRGGPDGGDGGRGGDIVFVARRRARTLLRFRYERHFAAEPGGNGAGNKKYGKGGKGITLEVPVGTIIYEQGADVPLVDLARDGMRAVVCRGGRGGRGNAHYATPVRQVPRFAELGEPAEDRALRLELKLLADVGLIGLPNAGKSTLLAHVSAAKPKIADYPFTTLEPQLGVVAVTAERSFVMADLPGLIEGAAQGRGRGTEFLRHAERSRVLLHIVDAAGGFAGEADPWEGFLTINREIALYGAGLEQLPMLVALNKTDLPGAADYLPDLQRNLARAGYRVFPISAATGAGVQPLLYAIDEILRQQEDAEAPVETPETVTVPRARRELEIARLDEHLWEVTGSGIERLIAMTDMASEEGVRRLQTSLERMGLFAMLKERGVQEGDCVRIRGIELEYTE
ncbi:MAG TPA: GTPase ObgE [Armatimonadota bacterium]|nr:GTPase ObgE [Armatimonadota bacterium]HOS42945.1 GTPase ObgE [Armatimonadota bacterium]